MIEFADVDERRVALMRMVGIESRVWVQVAGFADGTEARAARHDSRDGGGRAKQDARAEGWRGRGFDRVYAIADEDLERTTEDKTSSVHFLRFELTPAMVAAVKQGAAIGMGIEHEAYTHTVEAVAENVRRSLIADLS
jgi:hypothetical protein